MPHSTKDWVSTKSFGQNNNKTYMRFHRDIERGLWKLKIEVGVIDGNGVKLFSGDPNWVETFKFEGANVTIYFQDGEELLLTRKNENTFISEGIEYQ